MDRMREYHSVIADTWTMLKSCLATFQQGREKDSWWDCVMSEAGTVSDKYKNTECHDFAVRIVNAVLNELQRLAEKREMDNV